MDTTNRFRSVYVALLRGVTVNKLSRGKATHSDKLERWLGSDTVKSLSDNFREFYYPVAVHGVPGSVYVMPGGDFSGEIVVSSISKEDGAAIVLKKLRAKAEAQYKRHKALGMLIEMIKAEDRQLASIGAFASLDAVIAAFTGGKGQHLLFMKAGTSVPTAGNCTDLWTRAGTPAAGGAASAAPGGSIPTSATTGALGYANLGAANSGKYLNWTICPAGSNPQSQVLLYDRIFAVAKTMNSTATEAVTGVPTRYQNTTPGGIDYVGGNFCFPANPTTVLANTAHNWTVCQYTDQGGTTGNNFVSGTGIAQCPVSVIDLSIGNWFLKLATGDIGVKALTQMQCSAAVATGTIDFIIGHPIAVNPCVIAYIASIEDGLYTSLNLTPILDNACLAMLELPKGNTSAVSYSGIIRTVSE